MLKQQLILPVLLSGFIISPGRVLAMDEYTH
jgi:hypothetical protein